MITWLIGLSGSGKSTLAHEIVGQLRRTHANVVHVDGDVIREVLGNDLGHSMDDRRANARRMMRICTWLEGEGALVVCSILSLFPEHRVAMRDTADDYYEVFIDAPLDQLRARDGKGLYGRFDAGELTGVAGLDLAFPKPENADLKITNDGGLDALLAHATTIAQRMVRA